MRSYFVDTINTDLDTRPITIVKFYDLRPVTIDEVHVKKTMISCFATTSNDVQIDCFRFTVYFLHKQANIILEQRPYG